MKTTHSLCLLAGALSLITSCALPPREAMRIVQRNGLINYLNQDYSHYTQAGATTSAPLRVSQTPYTTPRPVNPAPYRTTYHTNRYAKAELNRVPYRPQSSHSSSHKSRTAASRSSAKREAESQPRPHRTTVASSTTANDKPRVTTASKDAPNSAPALVKKPAEALPYGTPVSGRPGMVTSPFAQKQQLVDVTGLAPGDTVKDPYSGKLFRVPPTQQAAASPAPVAAPPAAPAAVEKEKPAAATTSPAPTPAPPAEPTPSPAPDAPKSKE